MRMRRIQIFIGLASLMISGFLFGGCYTNQFGSYQEDGKINYISSEIKKLQKEVESLKEELVPDYSAEIERTGKVSDSLISLIVKDTSNNGVIRYLYENNEYNRREMMSEQVNLWKNKDTEQKIKEKKERIAKLESFRTNLVDSYIKFEGVPKEVTRYEAEARNTANDLRRQEMVLKKIENNLANSSNGLVSKNSGYAVIVENNREFDVQFNICPVNGGDKTSIVLAPNMRTTISLVPGSYLVSFTDGSKLIGPSRIFSITGETKYYKGLPCFGFIGTGRF